MKILAKFIYCISLLLLAYFIISLSYDSKNAWPITVIALVLIFAHNAPKIFENIKILKLGKEGVELETITQQAHNVTVEAQDAVANLKSMALILSEKTFEIVSRTGRWDSGYGPKELYEFKLEIYNSLCKLGLEKELERVSASLNRVIEFDIFYYIQKMFSSDKAINDDLVAMRKNTAFECAFSLDIDSIKEYFQSKNLINEALKTILDELSSFQRTGFFINKDFLNSIK